MPNYKKLHDLGGNWDIEPEVKDVRDFNVYDAQGDKVGEVEDLIVDEEASTISYCLIGRGVLGTVFEGRKAIAPLRKIDIDHENREAHLDVDKDELKDFPKYGDLNEPGFMDKVEQFWGEEHYRRPIEGTHRYATMPTTGTEIPGKHTTGEQRGEGYTEAPMPSEMGESTEPTETPETETQRITVSTDPVVVIEIKVQRTSQKHEPAA